MKKEKYQGKHRKEELASDKSAALKLRDVLTASKKASAKDSDK